MDQQASTFYELRFRAQYLESKAAAFQDLFVSIMSKAHPEDFFPCRPWGKFGDRKNDGYLKSERTLFQVYAPNEMRMADAVNKVETDFLEALPYWQEHFDKWVFVHNAHNGLPPDVIAKLLQLERDHTPVILTHWGFDELLERFRRLPIDAMRSLYGFASANAASKRSTEVTTKLQLADELMRDGKGSEAIKEMKAALAIVHADEDEEKEVEILVGLALSIDQFGPRHGKGDSQHYFRQAEKLVGKLKSSANKVIYFRARARALEEARDESGAEKAYRSALELCLNEKDDEQNNLAMQGCVVRTSLVHLLCNQKRLNEAKRYLSECEMYAREHSDIKEQELLQVALSAGIHFSLEAGIEDEAIQRIVELEEAASISRAAARIGNSLINIANRASHRNAHRTALVAAETSVRLGRRSFDHQPSLLAAGLYTEAMVILKAGNDHEALKKANALLDLCQGHENEGIRQATQHLIAEIKRCSGDSQTAVDVMRGVLGAANGLPEQIAFTKLAFARSLNDNGQTEEALKQASEAWVILRPIDIHSKDKVDILAHVINYASQLGVHDVAADAIAAIGAVTSDSEDIATEKARALARADQNGMLRERLLEFVEGSDSAEVTNVGKWDSLAAANAAVIHPLLGWWDDVLETGPEYVAAAYEFWGRGNFASILRNTRDFPNSFNVTLEVRSLDDVKRAIRLWGLYADFLILLWKGPTESAWQKMVFPLDFVAPGGAGYMIFLGTTLKREGSKREWAMGMGHGSNLPWDVAAFLATEARPFVQSGRLVVVPAVGAGCINPGHGPFEQLLAESANSIPSIRWKGIAGTPIGLIPYSPDAPLALLSELAFAESDHLRKLRLLLLRRSMLLSPHGDLDLETKMLSLEIEDALRDMGEKNVGALRKKGLASANERLVGTTARFRQNGSRLGKQTSGSFFAPIFALETMGYRWRVDGGDASPPLSRFQPKDHDSIGHWLAPPIQGWTVPFLTEDNESS
jgi:hypothetical protein